MKQNVLSIALAGDKETLDAFNALTGPEKTKARRSAMRKAAKDAVLPAVQIRTPVDSEKLLLSLQVIPGGRNFIGSYVGVKDRESVGVSPEDKWFYPAAVEFGTRYTPAQSYLRAGLDASKGKAMTIIAKSLQGFFKRRARKAAKAASQ